MASGVDVANKARAEMQEIGGQCGNNNKYTHWYSDNVDNIGYNFWWCAAFVTYVVRQCGVPTSVVPNYAYCPNCIDWARSRGRLYSKSQLTSGAYIPQPGDIFLREGHTGIIISVSGNQFTTVEGNTGGTENCRTVGSHTWTFSGGNYAYVFNPDYPDKVQSNGSYSSNGVESYMYSENPYSDNSNASVVWNNRVKENIHPRMQSLAPIAPTGQLTLYANDTDITKIAGNLAWKNSIYELATTMFFEVAKTDAAYLKDLMYTPQVGDIVRMVTNTEIFRGVITKVDDGDENSNKYTVVDLGWYLNKTSQTYQFKNIFVSDAIREICDDLSISIAMLPELNVNINQIYFDKTISDILTDILDRCYGDYNYDFVPEGLRIYRIGDLIAYPEFRVASNVAQAYSPEYKGSVSHSTSIEEMKNSIKITSEKDNVYTELMVLQNRELIDKYGFLQKIVKIDPEKENADAVAKRELNENSRESETYSFEIVEKYDSYTRAGEIIAVDDTKYVIESTDHSFKDGWHYDKLELRKF